jgi:hypothetical protein
MDCLQGHKMSSAFGHPDDPYLDLPHDGHSMDSEDDADAEVEPETDEDDGDDDGR